MLGTLTIIAAVIGCITLILIFLALLSPMKVEYEESIVINAPVARVFDDIRIQERLMRWSAWPKETKSKCAVDISPTIEGEDGTIGARTVFFTKGKRFGHQEITSIVENKQVVFTLEGGGPPHYPTMTFRLEERAPNETHVVLHFINRVPPPFNAIWNFAGLSRWTRKMHVKDLEGLKAFSEPPHRDSDGEIVGIDMTRPNPYAIPMPSVT